MIIGLMGLKGSGKDSVGAYLVKQYEFERRSFAYTLKKSFAALFDIPMSEIEDHKNDPTVMMAIGYANAPETNFVDNDGNTWQPGIDFPGAIVPDKMWSPIKSFSFRHALQRYGTEAHRDVFGPNFWVDQTLPVAGFYSGRKIVVTDCRFQNEFDRIHELGGVTVQVTRTGITNETLHSSENEELHSKADYTIINDGGFIDLYHNIETMIGAIGGIQGIIS